MNEHASAPRVNDLMSVGTRINWAAILGGGLVAFALYFMFTMLGAAVGLTVSDNVKPASLQTGAIIWGILTLSVALFVGGLMTSLFTVGETTTEAVFYGIIMWAFLLGLLLCLGASGMRGGYFAMARLSHVDSSTIKNWETMAHEAGVPSEQIADWRRKASTAADRINLTPENQKEMAEAATRIAWYVFGGMWISMLAAGLGAWLGAGPTFRVVSLGGAARVINVS